jgi:hypothetical protein
MEVNYDASKDVLTIDGMRYSGEIFRTLTLATPGTWFRIEHRSDGVVACFSPAPELAQHFDLMTARENKGTPDER